MKKFIAFFFIICFLSGCSKETKDDPSDTIPNLCFQVNKIACLFSQSYLEKEIALDLENEIKSSFSTPSSDIEKQSEFVARIVNEETNHEYITPTFANLFKNALLQYDPVFDKCYEILNNRKDEMKTYSEKILTKKPQFFKKVFEFYKSNIKEKHKFNVFIYPMFGQISGKVSSFKDNLMLKFNYGNKTSDLCLILKDLCHRLYDEMAENNKQLIEMYCLEHKSGYGLATYFILDEILSNTTMLWCHSKLNELSDSAAPQNTNKAIDEISKDVMTTVSNYLENGDKIDFSLLNSIILSVKKCSPESKDSFNIFMSKITLIIENGIDSQHCINVLNSNFKIKTISEKESKSTIVFIGNDLGNRGISKIHRTIPNRTHDFLFITKDNQNQLFIIIKTNDKNKIKKAIEKVKQLREIKIGFEEKL